MEASEIKEVAELRSEIHAIRTMAWRAVVGLLTVGMTAGLGAMGMVGSYKERVDTMMETQRSIQRDFRVEVAELRQEIRDLRAAVSMARRLKRKGMDDE